MPGSPWYTATVVGVRAETARAKTFRLQLPAPMDFVAGQHVVVRLTAPDGYIAQRSYSVASAPDGSDELELTVERLPDGEVSTFLHDIVEVGDDLEVRGPLGGFFVWDGTTPALLVGGGSGDRAADGRCCAWPAAPGARSRAPGGVGAQPGRAVLRRRAAWPGDDDRVHPAHASGMDPAPPPA